DRCRPRTGAGVPAPLRPDPPRYPADEPRQRRPAPGARRPGGGGILLPAVVGGATPRGPRGAGDSPGRPLRPRLRTGPLGDRRRRPPRLGDPAPGGRPGQCPAIAHGTWPAWGR